MVGYSCSTGKYQASLQILDKLIFLGEFTSYKEAVLVEKKASNETSQIIRRHLPFKLSLK